MDPFEHQGFWGSVPTRRRSNTHRKPRVDLHIFINDTVSQKSEESDEQFSENGSYDPNSKKVSNIKIVVLKKSSVNGFEMDGQPCGVTRHESSKSSSQRNKSPELRRCTDGVTAPNGRKNLTNEKRNLRRMSISSDDHTNHENSDGHMSYRLGRSSNGLTKSKLRKMKLKVGGITHTLQADTKAESGGIKQLHKDQGKSEEEMLARTENLESVGRIKRSKDTSLNYAKDIIDNGIQNKRKSRILKKRKAGYYEDDDYAICNSRKSREGKKSRSDIKSEDMDRAPNNRQGCTVSSDCKEMDEPLCSSVEEFSLMTRRRALQSSGGVAGRAIEFPNGLPSPPRRQKVQLSEVERQLKKVEAAQRRKLQLEKAARESEAEAIRKILGHDSSKKREHKLRQKLRQAQEREANSSTLPRDCVRWVFGPTGTTVTFPEGADLPSILNSKPCSYPPPREKCAGPSCSNPYKYRDSKTNLPLCSLQCYRAVQQDCQPFCVC